MSNDATVFVPPAPRAMVDHAQSFDLARSHSIEYYNNSSNNQHYRQSQFNGGPNRGGPYNNNGRSRGRGGWNRGRGRGGGGGKPQFLNMKKDNSRQGPEVNHNFYCCPCERGFKTQEQVDEHKKEHMVCGLDGCQFEAHALVVSKHIRMQHEGNLYNRMKNLNTPEDIERWRQERRKNYPTNEKAQQKDDEMKEKEERREICGVSKKKNISSSRPPVATFRYKIQKNDPNVRSFIQCERRLRMIEYKQSDEWMRRPFAPDVNARDIRVPFFSMNKSKVVHLENFYLNVKMGKDGTLKKQTKVKWKGFKVKQLDRLTDSESETEDASIPISDDEEDYFGARTKTDVEPVTPEKSDSASCNETTKVPIKPSGNLMLVDYSSASDSDQEEQEPIETPSVQKTESATSEDVKEILQSPVVGTTSDVNAATHNHQQDSTEQKLPNEETLDMNSDDSMVIEEFRRDQTFKDKPVFAKPRFRNRTGWFRTKLLETLLQDQIRKERNILLQTCRFVCENKFFGLK